jgi:hypothetical protein
MSLVGFEPTIPVFKQAKTVHALKSAATVIGRSTPWTGDQPVARPLPTHKPIYTQLTRSHKSMSLVGFEPTIPVFKQAKTVHALESAATVIGRSTPWTGDQPVARLLPTHRTIQTQNKRTHTSMSLVGFEPTIPVFKQAKTVHAASVIGRIRHHILEKSNHQDKNSLPCQKSNPGSLTRNAVTSHCAIPMHYQ